jgi:vancomycin resistance protein YoaR
VTTLPPDPGSAADPRRARTEQLPAQPAAETRLGDTSAGPADDIAGLGGPAREPRRRRRGRGWLVAGGVLAAGLAGAYGLAYLQYDDTVPAGTTVAGVEIGGLPVDDAEQLLAEELPGILDTPRTLVAGERTVEVQPSDLGVTADAAATVAQAGGGSANPVVLWRSAFGDGGEVAVVTAVDEAALAAGLATAAETLDVAPADGTVAFRKARVVTEHAVVGQQVDQEAAADAVVAAFPSGLATVELPHQQLEPSVTQQEVDTAVAELAKPAVSGPVAVTTAVGEAAITPSQLGAALSVAPDDDGTLALALDVGELRKAAREPLGDVTRTARNARVEISGGEPVVVASRTGRAVTDEELQAKIFPVLTATGDARAVTLELTTVQPKITEDDRAVTGVREVVSEFTTYFPHADYRNVNIGRAASLIDDTFLAPGEVFSLNGTVGERTRANGFTAGFIIADGQFREELGGGVSQVATTTFNAAHFAGFDDIEHKAHSLYISRYPRGREATVAWPSVDLKFKNNTPYGAVVQTLFSPSAPGRQGALTVRIWSTDYWQVRSTTGPSYNFRAPTTVEDSSDRCEPTSPVPGFDVKITRTLSRSGDVVRTESFVTQYQATNRVVCT